MKQLALIICTLLTVTMYGQTDQPLTCKGTTKSGKPCTSVIVSKKTGFCNAHNPNRPKCSAKNVKGEPCGMVPLKDTNLCRMHTKKGE
jgi:hypothetical protein